MWKSSSETTMALKRNVTKLVGGLREFSAFFFLPPEKKANKKRLAAEFVEGRFCDFFCQ